MVGKDAIDCNITAADWFRIGGIVLVGQGARLFGEAGGMAPLVSESRELIHL